MLSDFDRNGYVVLRKAFSEPLQHDLLSALRGTIIGQVRYAGKSHLLPEPPTDLRDFFENYVLAVEKLEHRILYRVYETFYDTAAAMAIFMSQPLLGISASILGAPDGQLFIASNRVRLDPPGPAPYRLGWHQESGYTRSRAREIQYWAPLVFPSSWENGSIEVGVGSHVGGRVTESIAEAVAREAGGVKSGATQNKVPEDYVAKFPVELVEIEPGDVLLFSCDLLHRSSDPTRQTRMKYSVVGRFTDAGSHEFSPYEGLPNW